MSSKTKCQILRIWNYEKQKQPSKVFCNERFFFFSIWVSFHESQDCREGGGHFVISSLSLPPALQKLRHQPGDYCRQITSADRQQPDSNREPLVSERKSLTTKLPTQKLFLEIRKIHRKTPGSESLFNEVVALRPVTLLKRRLWHRCFPVNFSKFLRTSLGDCFQKEKYYACFSSLLFFVTLILTFSMNY